MADDKIAETPDTEKTDIVQEDKSETETKEEKTPETPVTEPLTNGSSTPETPKEDSLTADEPITTVTEEKDRPELPKVEVTTEKISLNGLTVEESKIETPVVPVESENSKSEEPTIEKTEPVVPATEIPVIKEVCVEKMPLIEPTPPPLPANPPPSSVVSFAATTMAPELTDASLANTADIVSNSAHNNSSEKNSEKKEESSSDIETESQATNETNIVVKTVETTELITDVSHSKVLNIPVLDVQSEKTYETISNDISSDRNIENIVEAPIVSDNEITKDVPGVIEELTETLTDKLDSDDPKEIELVCATQVDNENSNGENVTEDEEIIENIADHVSTDANTDNMIENDDDTAKENLLNETKTVGKLKTVETNHDDKVIMNGDSKSAGDDNSESVKPIVTPEDSMPPSLSEAIESSPQGGGDASESFPLPPSELCRSESDMSPPDTPEPAADTPQEVLSTSDKMKELIPEIPTVPELKTELETTTDVAVTN